MKKVIITQPKTITLEEIGGGLFNEINKIIYLKTETEILIVRKNLNDIPYTYSFVPITLSDTSRLFKDYYIDNCVRKAMEAGFEVFVMDKSELYELFNK